MKLSTKLIVIGAVVLTGGRLTYLGYEKHVVPILSPHAPVTSAFGHELLAELQRPEKWRLSVYAGGVQWLAHQPGGELIVCLTKDRDGRNIRYFRQTEVKLHGETLTIFTLDDLAQIEEKGQQTAAILRDQQDEKTNQELRKILGNPVTNSK